MPITLLHFGLLAPLNHTVKRKVSNVSFILVNLWIDMDSIIYVLFGTGGISHGVGHSFWGTAITATVFAVMGIRSSSWVFGAYLGAFTHTLLDMLVHADMDPFDPVFMGNPFYMGWMEPLSLVLLPLTIWLIAQYVSGSLGFGRKYLAAWRLRTAETSVVKPQ